MTLPEIEYQAVETEVEDNNLPLQNNQKKLLLTRLCKPPRTVPLPLIMTLIFNRSFFYFILAFTILISIVNITFFAAKPVLPFDKMYTLVFAAPIGIGIAAPLFFLLMMGLESVSLLKSGETTKGKVSEIEESKEEPGAGRFTFRFKNKKGKYTERPFMTKKLANFTDTPEKYAFYNPKKPERFWLVDDFPEEIVVEETGEWKTPSPSALVPPILALIMLLFSTVQVLSLLRAFAWVLRF